jgi:acyl carrier protein
MRDHFRAALLDFINIDLPKIRQRAHPLPVSSATPLFDPGPIDSMGILHLIAFIEKTTGRPIPTRLVTMGHFRTVDAICESFGQKEQPR